METLNNLYRILQNIDSIQFALSKEIVEDLNNISVNCEERQLIDLIVNKIVETNIQIRDMQWMNNHLKILHDFGQIYSNTFNEELIFEKVLEVVSGVMPTDAFSIALYNHRDSEIHIPFAIDAGKRLDPITFSFDNENITSKVIKNKETSSNFSRNSTTAF